MKAIRKAFKAPKTIGNLFSFKDRIKETKSQSLVVYKINCKTCDSEYIGKTEPILVHRIKEHKNQKKSACHQHMEDKPGHEMDYDNIQVTYRESPNYRMKE